MTRATPTRTGVIFDRIKASSRSFFTSRFWHRQVELISPQAGERGFATFNARAKRSRGRSRPTSSIRRELKRQNVGQRLRTDKINDHAYRETARGTMGKI